MSEAREQYRERLARTAYQAFMDHMKLDGTEYDELLPETKDAMHAEAEAVASQVLRDVLDHMDLRFVVVGIDERDGNVRTAIDAIEAFAAERGIDLSE